MSIGIEQRLTALPIRLIYESEMPQEMLNFLRTKLKLSDYDSVLSGGRYQNFKHFRISTLNRDDFVNAPSHRLSVRRLLITVTIFEAIKAAISCCITLPYFRSHTELVRQASFDPKVTVIKINVYRVVEGSKLLNSIIDAAHNGKEKVCTVVVELLARFDEQANIQWAKRLQEAGVKAIYGIPSLKIHSKLLLIKYQERRQPWRVTFIGTGNFLLKSPLVSIPIYRYYCKPRAHA
ncbi:hypothetical protein OH492_23915 [Vibrio chagasii]|nr:hypothetical protein [Vibrio chagasii]